MANLQAIRTAVDQKLDQLWPVIQAKQDAYAANHGGRYWQGLKTSGTDPVDGAAVVPDVGNRTPTDQPGDPWPDAIGKVPLPMSIQVDTYDGPEGKGYVVTISARVNGTLYSRSQNVGPEDWRSEGWHVVDEAVP